MIQEFSHIKSVKGELTLPGDKSISHRAIIFSALAEGISRVKNLSSAEDVNTTKEIFSALGTEYDIHNDELLIKGKGLFAFKKPLTELNSGNSGTSARLITAILGAQKFDSIIMGDESLSKRPMKRVTNPLQKMGMNLTLSNDNYLPLKISAVNKLNPISYCLEVASAQVKSAVLIAGLFIDDITEVIETIPTRNHTELMLGLPIVNSEGGIIIQSSSKYIPKPQKIFVPSDISTASFFIVLTLLMKDSELIIKNVSLNPSRTGILEVLKKMGGNITIVSQSESCGELLGDLLVKSSDLFNIEIPKEIIPNIIDEIPILTIAGIFADGKFKVSDCKELRVKESDRIKSMVYNLRQFGLTVEEYEDGFEFESKELLQNEIVTFESFGDHRIAMAFSIFSLLLEQGGKINNFDCVKISNPQFIEQIKNIIG
ncbi:MAG: 3-phosphoshikimate 1-carboxyvinyltransferase [Ignavibacteriaceae bacterium]|nr:3-phosphoshikimate 1-carboxyvinyltransferase [Ignavibacteriaceae bacterium]